MNLEILENIPKYTKICVNIKREYVAKYNLTENNPFIRDEFHYLSKKGKVRLLSLVALKPMIPDYHILNIKEM